MQKLLLVIPVLALTLLCACSSGKTPAVAADIASASVSENTEAPAPDQEPNAESVSGSLPDSTPPPAKILSLKHLLNPSLIGFRRSARHLPCPTMGAAPTAF